MSRCELREPTALRDNTDSGSVEYTGGYSNWHQAQCDSIGYGADFILERVRWATAQVRDGKVAAERDGVTFDQPQWNWPLLACIGRLLGGRRDPLRVLDFGGSLGGTYYQVSAFFGDPATFEWSIVEQPSYVECGQREFQTDVLRFHSRIDSYRAVGRVDVLLVSGSVQYLERPYTALEELLAIESPFVLIDRTPLIESSSDLLTVQQVPEWIYGQRCSYPAWFLSAQRFHAVLSKKYDEVVRFDALDGRHRIGEHDASYFGYLYQRRDSA